MGLVDWCQSSTNFMSVDDDQPPGNDESEIQGINKLHHCCSTPLYQEEICMTISPGHS